MIVFNEKEYIKQILDSRKKPQKMSDFKLISYIAKYYYDKFADEELYLRFVLDVLYDFNDKYNQKRHIYEPLAKKICHHFVSGKWETQMFCAQPVTIYKEEMEKINTCQTLNQKKILFTLYVLAKIKNNHNGWINYSKSDIIDLSGTRISKQEWLETLRYFYLNNLATISKNPHIKGIKIELQTDGAEFAIIDNFSGIGKQYVTLTDKNWMLCTHCGKLIRRHSNRQKYCKKCYKEVKSH